ncbi:MAG TPA: hypothetical protein VGN18_00625 [Jatrophihabitans sp.]|jgi:hypothetical protein|uniref:hypothetical protein n=1 Tax=Jatrophihabitans sp. TaxID=1932789 RepID=UPI002DF9C1EC|nr:hypothetical protein [Jatrophihabitans sp.]
MGKGWKGRIPVPQSVEVALDTALDKALTVQRPVIQAYVTRVRAKNPDMTPAELVRHLERRYVTAVMGIGGASGAAAAVPGAGTAASIASGAAEITAFVSASAMFVLALAELHGVPVSDPEVRRALVVAVLVGEGGEAVLAGAGATEKHWAQVLGRSTSKEKVGTINSRLGRMLLTRFGARQGALLFGRALPLGIGAGVGAAGNAALARAAIGASRKAFGPAPATFPPKVIDAAPAR